MPVAFELRAQHKPKGPEPFDGGGFALQDGSRYDIAKALQKGKGTIVTDDPYVIDRLREVEALKETKAPAAPSAARKRTPRRKASTTTTTAAGNAGGERTEA